MTTQELERYSPQERALVKTAQGLGILQESGGALVIDLSSAKLAQQFNVLAPAATLIQADPNFTPSVSVVTLSKDDFYEIEKPKPASGNYPAKPGAYALSKRALDVIGKQAGIEDLGPEIAHFGAHDENLRVTWHCRVRRPDGTFQTLAGTREWIEADEEELFNDTAPDWAHETDAKWRKYRAEQWLGRIKRHRLGMTETKARLRAYRQALTLKSKYAQEEVNKPFLVVSTTFTPDTSDIRVLGMLMQQGTEAAATLYGRPPAEDAIPGTCSEDTGEHQPIDPEADSETGEIKTYGERPQEDPVLPAGPYEGLPLSQVAREHADYVREQLPGWDKHPLWSTAGRQWLRYWNGEGGDDNAISF